MKYDIEFIKTRFMGRVKPNIIFFWKHTTKSIKINATCLSQWYPAKFTINNVTYCCAEQYMMAQKAIVFHDNDIYKQIMESKDPNEIKALGRKIAGFSDEVWDQHKIKVVYDGNYAKFSQNKRLKNYLIETENAVLAEASPYDSVWGIRMAEDNPLAQHPNNWKGQNLLGFILMEVRDDLRKED